MVPPQKRLEDELGLPVTIDNEANAGAQGERASELAGMPAISFISVPALDRLRHYHQWRAL